MGLDEDKFLRRGKGRDVTCALPCVARAVAVLL
jgi:hypothetical protein